MTLHKDLYGHLAGLGLYGLTPFLLLVFVISVPTLVFCYHACFLVQKKYLTDKL